MATSTTTAKRRRCELADARRTCDICGIELADPANSQPGTRLDSYGPDPDFDPVESAFNEHVGM